MLDRTEILRLLAELNEALSKRGERGEVGVVGGAAMCLVFNARASTKDVDAIFRPATIIRTLAKQIGEDHGLAPDWLNDAVKGFLEGTFERIQVWNGTHLQVWAPEPRYLLAMKCLSARWDTLDRKDVEFLIGHLKIQQARQVFKIIETYYPKNRVPPKTIFFIEELFQKRRARRN